MKKNHFIFLLLLAISSCKKDMPEPPTEVDNANISWGTYSEYYVTFFSNNFAGSALSITLNGDVQTITYAYSYYPPCGAVGCANFTVAPGSYIYYVSDISGSVRTGSFKTGSSQCITILTN